MIDGGFDRIIELDQNGNILGHWVSRDTRRDGLRGDTLWPWGKMEKSTPPMC